MSNLNWCTYCDNAINHMSNSLYCSENCLRSDALNRHPLLGYDYAELKDFPRSTETTTIDFIPLPSSFLKKDDDSITSSSLSSVDSLSSFYQALNKSPKKKTNYTHTFV